LLSSNCVILSVLSIDVHLLKCVYFKSLVQYVSYFFFYSELLIPALAMSDSEDDPDLPSAEVCGQRCDEFAKITGTDSALAMFFLQDRNWDLEVCLSVSLSIVQMVYIIHFCGVSFSLNSHKQSLY